MSEIINPPPEELSAAQETASRHDAIDNPPLGDGDDGVALDEHLNPNPNVPAGASAPGAGSGAAPAIENPPPWSTAAAAAPEHEAPPLEPLDPPAPDGSDAAATAAKPKTSKRKAPAKKTRK